VDAGCHKNRIAGRWAIVLLDILFHRSHFKCHFPSAEENADNTDWTKPLARQLGGRAAWQT
jgi:hypothetical protein